MKDPKSWSALAISSCTLPKPLRGSSGLFQKRILDQTYDNGDDRAGDTPADGLACRRRDIEATAGGRASESRNHHLQELAANEISRTLRARGDLDPGTRPEH